MFMLIFVSPNGHSSLFFFKYLFLKTMELMNKIMNVIYRENSIFFVVIIKIHTFNISITFFSIIASELSILNIKIIDL